MHRNAKNSGVISGACRLALGMALVSLAYGCAEDDGGPQLLPIPAQTVKVDQSLSLFLPVDNPRGDNLALAFSGPPLPSLQSVARVTSTPQGGLFLYTPLASHVGTHQFTFTVFGGGSSHQQLVAITVETPQTAAPVFLTPGKGGTYDLGVSTCIKESLEVKDDDTAVVDIRARETLPAGATLTKKGDKRARLEWCPTAEQVNATLTWQLAFEADDGEHSPTPHDYTVVLRPAQGGAGQCPGSSPVITVVSPWAGEVVESPSSFAVMIEVTDDTGVKEPPILYWTDTEPLDPGSTAEFQQSVFQSSGGPSWVAEVPPLSVDSATIWFKVSATDNDDPHGTACDHRTDTPVVSFTAQVPGAAAGIKADLCDACSSNDGCYSGHCVLGSSGGKCLTDCVPPISQCTAGACIEAALVDGTPALVCGDVEAFCGGASGGQDDCTPDLNEPNDSAPWATPLGDPSSTWHSEGASICAGDHDFFRIETTYESDVTVSVSGFESGVDLDFKLVTLSGDTVATGTTLSPTETASHCLAVGDEIYADVYSFVSADQSPYQIEVQRSAGTCCVNDAAEPDDTIFDAPVVALGQDWTGTLCPNDTDMRMFQVDVPQNLLLKIDVSSTDQVPSLSLSILNADGGLLSSTSNVSGDFVMSFFPWSPGEYFAKVTSNGYDGIEFSASVEAGESEYCFTTTECPIGTVCELFSGTCDSSICYGPGVCPFGSICDLGLSFEAAGTCVVPCEDDLVCRTDQGEHCKAMLEGSHCGLAGNGALGDACETHVDCSGALSCFGWPGGYCTEIGCATNDACGPGSFCRTASIAGQPYGVCTKMCLIANSTCRADEGYVCALTVDKSFELQEGCVPSYEEGDWL